MAKVEGNVSHHSSLIQKIPLIREGTKHPQETLELLSLQTGCHVFFACVLNVVLTFPWPNSLFQRSSLSTAWTTRSLTSWWLDLVAWLTRTRPSCRERGTPWGSPWPWLDTYSWMLRYGLYPLNKVKSHSVGASSASRCIQWHKYYRRNFPQLSLLQTYSRGIGFVFMFTGRFKDKSCL